jgi:hypothetical protein
MGFWANLFGFQSNSDYSEETTYKKIKSIFEKGSVKILRNLYIPYRNEYSEIDIVVIGKKKIYVVENKAYNGWIFGNENGVYWTQCLNKNSKYKFYNPIKQNRTHINALSKQLKLSKNSFISVIVFGDTATLKKIPENVETCYITNQEKLFTTFKKICDDKEDIFNEQYVNQIYETLLPFTTVDETTKAIHIENIKSRHKLT